MKLIWLCEKIMESFKEIFLIEVGDIQSFFLFV